MFWRSFPDTPSNPMAVPAAVGDFLAVVRKSGLIEERKLLEVFPDPGSVPEDPQKIAAILLRSGLLTQFQAKQLLIGKFRGFMLGTYKLMEPIPPFTSRWTMTFA